MSKKVVIIGSGLGGLSTAILLAKVGFEVTVLEQSTQIGGCLQCFKRHGVKFETGMHFIGSADEDQPLHRLMKVLEIDRKLQLSRLDPNGYDVIALNGKQYKFANGQENFINQLCLSFPDQYENLKNYWNIIEKVAQMSSLHSLRFHETENIYNMEYQMRSMDDVIDSVISNPELANVLAGNLPLYAAEKGKTPFGTHAFIMDFYNKSAFRVVGGSDMIAKALVDTLSIYNGKVYIHKAVNRIVCNTEKAVGVECTDNSYFEADFIISSTHPIRTLEMLKNVPLIRPAYRQRLINGPQTIGGFAVYLNFKPNTVKYMNHNFYSYNQCTPWNCENYTAKTWPKGYLYMHFCHKTSPQYAQAGVVLSYMHIQDVEKWKGTKVGHRGEDYEQFKLSHAERLIANLEKDFPGITSNIQYFYTSTPLTYLDYTGTENGSMYGIAKDVNTGSGGRVSHRTKIPNLLLTGQNINSHGMLGTLVGTIVTCSELIPKNQLYSLIKNS